ncbi:MAG TPA: alpha/beta hydrolase [Hyphomicrobiaceae bacterium]|jgi:pimeloyl-ACP methyl ester carboxylesterase|nr:alpha/beta hydrolase [Hyphomicrobiaceae bacterium]
MIDDARGRIDYEECGAGPTVVLVPGSCSTGAVWRPMIESWSGRFRCVTTSLLGYGRTAERRSAADTSIEHEAEAVEAVIRRAGGPVHLVGHSFGGLVGVAVALRKQVPLAGLAVLEAPAMQLLRERDDDAEHYRAFRAMNEVYFGAFERGEREAVATMIDFYGGAGTYASWPARVRAYAEETTAVNILDWASAYAFPLTAEALSAIDLPTLVVWGGASNPAAQRANARLGQSIRGAATATVDGAAHFMISTHAGEVARLVAGHIGGVEAQRGL